VKWKWVEWSALSLVVMIIALGSIGFVYEQRAVEADRNTLSIPGRIVPVDGFGMHLHCTGVGSPTVVLEAGSVGFAQSWARIQKSLSETTRVCSYDRAGMGWSEDWGGHDGPAIAHNLRALLHAGGEAGPFIVVGHSLGASFARIFAGAYGEEVVGMGMIDPTHPDQLDRFGLDLRADQEDFRRRVGVASKLAHFGVLRAFDFLGEGASEGPPGDHVSAGGFFLSSPGHLAAAHAELLAWDETMRAARRVEDLGDMPLTVISSTESFEDGTRGRVGIRHRMHVELATLSERGQHVRVSGADRVSVLTNPTHAEQVAEHLRALVEEARAGAPPNTTCPDPGACWAPSGSATE